MEWGDEEATQESSRRGARQIRRFSPKRCQKAGQPREWPQGRPGQKPQEVIEVVIASIRARFGDGVIGLGDRGIRFAGTAGASVPHARTA